MPALMVGTSLVCGLAGKVEKGPSRTERLLGGRPRSLPVVGLEPLDQAAETAGPWRRRERLGEARKETGWG